MRDRLIVYSCIFGRTDDLKEPADPGSTRFVMFTDQPIRSKHWEIVRVPKLASPKRESRKYKQPSHRIFPDAEATLWIDASFRLLVDPLDLLDRFPHDMHAFRHDRRNRITDEAQAIILAGKGRARDVRAQLAAYVADGWDTPRRPQQRLTNGGFLLRRHTPRVIAFNEAWHHEVQTRCLRDQMSIDYCAHKVGLTIHHLPGRVSANPFARFRNIRKPTNDF